MCIPGPGERPGLHSIELHLGWQVDGEMEEWDGGMKQHTMQFANAKVKGMFLSPAHANDHD